jgi:hypothetical protein
MATIKVISYLRPNSINKRHQAKPDAARFGVLKVDIQLLNSILITERLERVVNPENDISHYCIGVWIYDHDIC